MDFLSPPLLQVFSKEIVWNTFIHSVAILTVGYVVVMLTSSSVKTSKRKRSWILTLLSSAVMTLGSLISVHAFVTESGFDLSRHPTLHSELDVVLCTFFIAYLAMDLVIGLLHYRDQITFLSGYFHHFGYMYLLVWLIHHDLVTPFCLMAVLEVPTFLLSIGQIWKPMRHDMVFGLSYFSTRITYHGIMIYQFYQYFPYKSWWFVLLGVYPLHLYWFNGWISQQRKLRQRNKIAASSDESLLLPELSKLKED